jgi:hypothetical protein
MIGQWLLSLIAIVGLGQGSVLLVNDTGLAIARIEIDSRRLETKDSSENQVLINVTPTTHDLKLVFRGGAQVEWPHFDFKAVREIIFERNKNKIEARAE